MEVGVRILLPRPKVYFISLVAKAALLQGVDPQFESEMKYKIDYGVEGKWRAGTLSAY